MKRCNCLIAAILAALVSCLLLGCCVAEEAVVSLEGEACAAFAEADIDAAGDSQEIEVPELDSDVPGEIAGIDNISLDGFIDIDGDPTLTAEELSMPRQLDDNADSDAFALYDRETEQVTKSLSLCVGEEHRLLIRVPKGYEVPETIIWTSSDTDVATVDDDWKVKGVGIGNCVIRVEFNDINLECSVSVSDYAELAETSVTMGTGSVITMMVQNCPSNMEVIWSSSDDNVATVNGVFIYGMDVGECIITADLGYKKLECSLTVTESAYFCEDKEYMSFQTKEKIEVLQLKAGDSFNLMVNGDLGRPIAWFSDNADVATVDSGVVTATGGGQCTITATVGHGIVQCDVMVFDPAYIFKTIQYDSYTVTEAVEEEISLNVGETVILGVSGDNGRTVSWSSDDHSVATVVEGKVKAVDEGECTITAKVGGTVLTCDVVVDDRAMLYEDRSMPGYAYDSEDAIRSASLDVGSSLKLYVTYTEGRPVVWSSSNKNIAEVTNKGKITAKRGGKCTIIARVGSNTKLSCKVRVVDRAELDPSKLVMNMGDTASLTVKNLANRGVTWSSSNRKIATVINGTVQAKKTGKCVITASVKNGKALKCAVTVVDGAAVSDRSLSLYMGETYNLTVSGLVGRKVTWSSSNKNVATVKKGKIKAKKAGKCSIIASVKNGKKLTCKLTVNDPAMLSRSKLTLSTIDTERITVSGLIGRGVKWSSSNSSVVRINQTGSDYVVIDGKKQGTATIRAKVSGGRTLKCTVKVVKPLTCGFWSLKDTEIYNDLVLRFSNHSNKSITYVELEIEQYNNRGDLLESPYSEYHVNETIMPHTTEDYKFWVHDETKKVKVKIIRVTFADGSFWKP